MKQEASAERKRAPGVIIQRGSEKGGRKQRSLGGNKAVSRKVGNMSNWDSEQKGREH